jgi:phage recombination protein Bet
MTTRKDLVTLTQSDALQAQTVAISRDQMQLIKRTVAAGATDEELQLFVYDCKRQGVHPLDKLIHFSKRGGRYTPITSIDFMRMRAAETGELVGNEDPTFRFRDGETVIPSSATVTVYRLDRTNTARPYSATARWTEYLPPKGQDFMWLKMPQLMLGKCAEALALRKAFPKQLHGIYERAEMMQAGEGPSHDEGPGRRDHQVTPPSTDYPPRRDLDRAAGGARSRDRGHDAPESDRPRDPAAESAAAAAEPSSLFADPDAEDQNDDVEREALLVDVRRLRDTINASKTTKKAQEEWAKDQTQAWDTHVGKGITPSQANPASLYDLKKWLETRLPK